MDLRVKINKFKLDEEWINQPDQVYFFSRQMADRRHELDCAKSNLDLVKAEVESSVRKDPQDYNIVKATEGAIQSAIYMQIKYQRALKKVNDLKHDVAVSEAAVNALEHRKRALESLVKLHGMSYFSELKTDDEDVEDLEKKHTRRKGIKSD